MSDTDIDFEAAGALQEAIEEAGGEVREFEMKEVGIERGAMFQQLAAMMGSRQMERRYVFEVAIPGPTSRDIDVKDAGIDGDEAWRAVAAAAEWADREGLDALAADAADVADRIGKQVHGNAHPSDEQEAFDTDVDG